MNSPTRADVRRALKPVDSAWTVLFVDPIAVRVLPLLAPRRAVTPVRLTVVAQTMALGAAASFAFEWLILGALLFEVRFVIDCLDGKLARLRGTTSTLGAVLDTNGDRVVVTLAFLGLAVGAEAPWAGAACASAYLVSMAFQDLRDRLHAEEGTQKLVDRVGARGLGAALRRRRIFPTVTTIEVEHAALFVAPLVSAAVTDIRTLALVVAATYFGLQAGRYAVSSLRAAARADRTG